MNTEEGNERNVEQNPALFFFFFLYLFCFFLFSTNKDGKDAILTLTRRLFKSQAMCKVKF